LAGVGGGVLFTPLAVGLLGVDVNLARTGGLLVAMTTSSVAGSLYLWRGVANLRLVAYAGAAMSLGAFLGARLGLFLAGVEGGRRAVEVGLGVLLLLVFFVLLGRRVEWPPRRVDRLAVRLGFVGEFWEESLGSMVRYGAGRTAWGLAAAFGVGLVSGVFGVGGGWALVPVFNLVMGLPLKVAVACSEAAIALGDAAAVATYLSAGLRPDFLVSTQVGAALGAFLGARVAAFVKARIMRLVVLGVLLLAAVNLLAP
jgi:hypothetical protein